MADKKFNWVSFVTVVSTFITALIKIFVPDSADES